MVAFLPPPTEVTLRMFKVGFGLFVLLALLGSADG